MKIDFEAEAGEYQNSTLDTDGNIWRVDNLIRFMLAEHGKAMYLLAQRDTVDKAVAVKVETPHGNKTIEHYRYSRVWERAIKAYIEAIKAILED